MPEIKEINSRVINPLVYPLIDNAPAQQTFYTTVNTRLEDKFGVSPIGMPYVESVQVGFNTISVAVVPINLESLTSRQVESFRGLLRSLYAVDELREGNLSYSERGRLRRLISGKDNYLYMHVSGLKSDFTHPKMVEGILIKGDLQVPKPSVLEFRYGVNNQLAPSEVELAYLSVMARLILSNKVDLSTPDEIAKSLPFRRELFMDIYQRMLKEFRPQTVREGMFGLGQQIEDISRNLYQPLKTKNGIPMNTLMVGAPGTGKTYTGSYFMTDREVLTVPVSIGELTERFEGPILHRVKRLGKSFGLPVVMLVEDVEQLLEANIMVDADGSRSHTIDPRQRAYALTLLERMQDIHKVYLLASLNHPDVEAAFLRRFNPVYFPLPSERQRREMLEKIIAHRPSSLSKGEYDECIASLLEITAGFNYDGLSHIPRYLSNSIAAIGRELNSSEWVNALQQACEKASQRTNKREIGDFDSAAREMMGIHENGRKILSLRTD